MTQFCKQLVERFGQQALTADAPALGSSGKRGVAWRIDPEGELAPFFAV